MIQIFQCTHCLTKRIYGVSEWEPDQTLVLLDCEGPCKKATFHLFVTLSQACSDISLKLREQSFKKHWDVADEVFMPVGTEEEEG